MHRDEILEMFYKIHVPAMEKAITTLEMTADTDELKARAEEIRDGFTQLCIVAELSRDSRVVFVPALHRYAEMLRDYGLIT